MDLVDINFFLKLEINVASITIFEWFVITHKSHVNFILIIYLFIFI